MAKARKTATAATRAKARAPVPAPPPPGRATINDIARLAKVSKKTVSRVINHSPYVRDETRSKISAVMEKIGYSPDPQARGLAFRRSFLIGMVYDNPNAQYIVSMQEGALDALRDSGYELVVHPCDRKSPELVAGVRRFVTQQKLHGVIVLPPVSENQALAGMLAEVGCRYVRVASAAVDEPGRMIMSEDRAAAVEVAHYLESLGHRRVAMITGPHNFRSALERREGFLGALQRRGIKVAASRIVEGGYTFESGVACAERLLALEPRPTAIFASNDEMAAGVYRTAFKLGLAVPGDLSIVGFDDFPGAARLWPALTTVRLPIRDIGRSAASLLIAEPDRAQAIARAAGQIMPHLVVRDSCQPPR
jgi:LacI family transcriptional regulator